MADVAPVCFRNSAGQQLVGTLHSPEATGRVDDTAVVLLSPGIKMRVGPGRLYVPLTELLVSRGYTVLRFDFFGLGDSEGELTETLLADVYNNIEVGRFVDDTLCALRWLREENGFKSFILGGLCGGAITALLSAERDTSVIGVLSLGMTVTLASNAATPGKYMSGMQLDEMRKGYLLRLLRPASWVRFLTFRSDYDVIWHSMRRLFVRQPPKVAVTSVSSPTESAQRGNANPLFPKAFFAFIERGGKVLLVFSGKDRLYGEYLEKFEQPHSQRLKGFQGQITQHVVAGANHVFSLREWRDEMHEACDRWLATAFRRSEA